MTIEGPPVIRPWVPAWRRGSKLVPQGTDLIHEYETAPVVLPEADWVYLQVIHSAYQIHPASVDELGFLGDLDSRNAARWTIEGPLYIRPGDPGASTNCALKIDVACSLSSAPGDDWKLYVPGHYRLRSVKARITVTRPNSTYDFKITRFAIQADRTPAPQRSRKVATGVSDVIPAGMCRVVVRDFEVLGTLEIEAGAHLEILT